MQELSLKSGGGRNFGRGHNLGRVRYNYIDATEIPYYIAGNFRGAKIFVVFFVEHWTKCFTHE